MSAITGIFLRDDKIINLDLIKSMNDKLAHRGPDGSSIWFGESVAFGHQMLYTTYESLHEQLPFKDINSDLVITADSRIDNRDKLSGELGIENNETIPDSYFILKAYEMWGENCPEKLLGDFAFAIYDKNKEELFCARDHMGIKPFYYYLSDKAFYFATEVKAILSILNLSFEINEVKVAQSLVAMHKDQEITFYDGISRLPAACSIKVDKTDHVIEKYWSLDPTFELKLESEEEYVKKFKEIFTESVRCRMRRAFPLGSLLSGGLDSSSITCTARQILLENGEDNLKTFSAVFDDVPQCDEKEFIGAVVSEGHIDPYYLRADKIGPLVDYEKIQWYCDEPLLAPNVYIAWCIQHKAKNEGVRIVLEGFDGDTIISHGKGYLNELLKQGKIISFINELNAFSKHRNINPYKHLMSIILETIAPERLLKYRNRVNPENRKKIIKSDFAQNISINSIVETMLKQNIQKPQNPREIHYNTINSGLLQFWLETADKIGGAAGTESRYPYLDRRLVEYCLALPTDLKIKDGLSRIILRRAMEDILPAKIRWRPLKTRIGSNFRRNFIMFNDDLIKEVIYRDFNVVERYVDKNMLVKYYEAYKKESNNTRAVGNIWRTVTLGLWLKSQN